MQAVIRQHLETLQQHEGTSVTTAPTSGFGSTLRQGRQRPGFKQSELQVLIFCMDRHPDWAVIARLVSGSQEINTGEAVATCSRNQLAALGRSRLRSAS